MYKSFIAGITALSMTFGSAAPTHAAGLSEEEIGQLLFGLAAIATIGTIIENRNDRRADPAPTPRAEPQQRSQRHTHRGRNNRRNGWHTQNNRMILPRRCLRDVDTRFGTHRMFGRRCLENRFEYASELPRRCEVRVFTQNGPRRGYDPSCLRSQGYTARR